MPMNSRILAQWGLAIGGLVTGLVYLTRPPDTTSEIVLESARQALKGGEHEHAERLARQAASLPDASPWARLVAAEAALKANRFADALTHYQQVPRSSPQVSSSADFGEAEMLCHLGRLSESEEKLRQLLTRDSHNHFAHYRLAFLLNITGRRWEARSHLLHLVRNSTAELEHLLLLGNSQRQVEDRNLLDATARLFPNDPLPKLGAARLAMALNHYHEALPLLNIVLAKRPDEPEALLAKGQLFLEETDPNLFIIWSSQLPRDADRHPDVWVLRGIFAQRNHQLQMAARCFWEALRRHPEHLAACYQLGRCLTELDDAGRADPFLRRAESLQRLNVVLDDLFHHRDHLESMRRASILSKELGRLWEAASWSSIAMSLDSKLPWALEILQEVSPQLHSQLPQTLPTADPSNQIDLSAFPLPKWDAVDRPADSSSTTKASFDNIRFTDWAQRVGINFLYENAADETTPGARIFETTGGGAGVIDYDVDGWPDLYLTQGGADPTSDKHTGGEPADCLFRNHAGERFEEIAKQAMINERDFSQGVTVGDFDNDGFPDLYVANLGQNRLYWNRGDGTFEDLTSEAGISDSQWTTSCLMADLDGDGFPDLYDVNYAGGESLLTRICEKQGIVRSCSPRAFDPAPDRVWLNRSDRRFRDVTSSSGADRPNGYGLGIVALDLDGTGKLSLFVANDEVPNFLMVNVTRRLESLRFEERGLEAGVALDADGRSQACMGIAAADADGDGMIDFLVTNFYQESNTLYLQIAPGLFADATRTSGLREPSLPMLGFGTQFLDANLDGNEDLVVTNGHIDDLTSIGEPYKMRAQFFVNSGGGRFRELPAQTLGPFFEETHLGRGLARLDWNRDGRSDFVVSHLREPLSLMTNETSDAGHFLTVHLRGTRCSRDAIGTRVEITVRGRRSVRQLTAGDGYHASNERALQFGLARDVRVDQLSVRWPGGRIETHEGIDADQAIILIEGREDWIPISNSHSH